MASGCRRPWFKSVCFIAWCPRHLSWAGMPTNPSNFSTAFDHLSIHRWTAMRASVAECSVKIAWGFELRFRLGYMLNSLASNPPPPPRGCTCPSSKGVLVRFITWCLRCLTIGECRRSQAIFCTALDGTFLHKKFVIFFPWWTV